MKRLIATLAIVAAISSHVFAYDELLANTNYKENNWRKMYIRANIGSSMLDETKDRATNIKMNTKKVPYFQLGIGTYFMDNTRVDLTIDHLTNPALKRSANRSLSSFIVILQRDN